jgi:hypothetical protein
MNLYENKLLNKDKLWNKLKRYLYYIIFLLSLLIILLLYMVIITQKVFTLVSDHT